MVGLSTELSTGVDNFFFYLLYNFIMFKILKMSGGRYMRRARHIRSQMRYFSGASFKKNALLASQNATWRYARHNVLSK